MADDDEEKLRRRRERAAAWAQKKMETDGLESLRKLNETTEKLAAQSKSEIVFVNQAPTPQDEASQNETWMNWAKKAGGESSGGSSWKQTPYVAMNMFPDAFPLESLCNSNILLLLAVLIGVFSRAQGRIGINQWSIWHPQQRGFRHGTLQILRVKRFSSS
jgi:hypothetical protein